MGSSVVSDFIVGFFHVIGTTISSQTKSVLFDLAGIPDVMNPDDDQAGEVARQQLAYGPLGLIVNPLDPGKMPDHRTPAQADLYGVRSGDVVIPLVGFDPRIDAAFPNGPKKGTVALVGYGGGFHSIDLNADGGNIHVLYTPVRSDPPGAHAIILDPTAGNESISIVHAHGHAVLLTQDNKIVLRSPNGSVSAQVSDSGIVLFGNTVIAGGATIGSPTGAQPAAKAPDVAATLTDIHAGVIAALGAITAPGGGPAAVAAYNAATTFVPTLIAAIPAVNTNVF